MTKKQYTRITKNEFEQFLNSLEYDFDVINHPSGEYVYKYSNPIDGHPQVSVRVFSTIDKRTGVSRDKDSDAIRTVIFDSNVDANIGGHTKTLRIQTWSKNLEKKIAKVIENASRMVDECEGCKNGWLVEREGQYGKFLGCTNYPRCEKTEQME
jgi:hypothetical protein